MMRIDSSFNKRRAIIGCDCLRSQRSVDSKRNAGDMYAGHNGEFLAPSLAETGMGEDELSAIEDALSSGAVVSIAAHGCADEFLRE